MSSTHEEWKFTGADGLSLYAQSWRPDGQARALVALVHGIGEHSGRYVDLVDHLVANGFEVYGFDHRGHGRSPGARGHVNAWTEYVEDVAEFLHSSQELNPGLPAFLYGHSMGALIALDYVLAYPEGLAGLVVSGVPLQPSGVAKRHLIAMARILSRIVPAFSISLGLDVSGISRDPAAVAAYRDDPLVHSLASMRWGTEILASIDRVRLRAAEVRLPILILHGGADPINAVDGSRELHEAVSSKDNSLRIYPGTFHEPHNDLDRATVSEDVQRWLSGRLGGAPTDGSTPG